MPTVISKDGTSIAFEKTGKGPSLILVDGALCSRAFGPMSKLSKLLSENFTVFIYDRRGRNQSGDTKPYAAEREVEDLEALIKEAGGSAYMVGLSSGAALALEAAASGLNITRLALYEPPFLKGMGGHEPPANSGEQLNKLIASGNRGAAVKFFMHDMVGMPSIFTAIFPLLPVWSKLKAVAHTLPYDAAIMNDFSLPVKRAASLRIPALVMGGTKSPANMRNAVETLAKTIPNSKINLLKGQTHNVSNAVLAPELINFFNH